MTDTNIVACPSAQKKLTKSIPSYIVSYAIVTIFLLYNQSLLVNPFLRVIVW